MPRKGSRGGGGSPRGGSPGASKGKGKAGSPGSGGSPKKGKKKGKKKARTAAKVEPLQEDPASTHAVSTATFPQGCVSDTCCLCLQAEYWAQVKASGGGGGGADDDGDPQAEPAEGGAQAALQLVSAREPQREWDDLDVSLDEDDPVGEDDGDEDLSLHTRNLHRSSIAKGIRLRDWLW